MGYMCHHTIVVESWDRDRLEKARDKALEIFTAYDEQLALISKETFSGLVSPVMPAVINGSASFCVSSFYIAPDGSKEGWGTSDAGDEARKKFCDWLASTVDDDGGSSLKWAEVQFGDECKDNRILRSEDNPNLEKG